MSAYRIFLAHASEDKEVVSRLHSRLKSHGFRPWLDEIDLLPGQNWRTEIPKAIRAADLFLACLSNDSVTKQGYIQKELRLALNTYAEKPPGSVYLIPVRLDDCVVPDLKIPELGINLRDIHWLNLWGDGGFQRLLQAIDQAGQKQEAVGESGFGLQANRLYRHKATRDKGKGGAGAESGNSQWATADAQESRAFDRRRNREHARGFRIQAGGALSGDAVYVERRTDGELRARLLRKIHGLVTVRAPRQMGKTSLLIRLGAYAREIGRTAVHLDMCAIGFARKREDWLRDVSLLLADELAYANGDSRASVESEETLESLLLSISSPTVLLIDEVDGVETETCKEFMEIVHEVTRRQLVGDNGNVCIVLAFVPASEELTSTIIPPAELGYHTRLPRFSLSESACVFELAEIDASLEQVNEVQELSGGVPYLVQRYAEGLQRGQPLTETSRALLGATTMLAGNLTRFLRDSDWVPIRKVARGKKLSAREGVRLVELEIAEREKGAWRFSSSLVEQIFVERIRGGWGRKSWWSRR